MRNQWADKANVVYFIVNDPLMQTLYYEKDNLEYSNIISLFTWAQELMCK